MDPLPSEVNPYAAPAAEGGAVARGSEARYPHSLGEAVNMGAWTGTKCTTGLLGGMLVLGVIASVAEHLYMRKALTLSHDSLLMQFGALIGGLVCYGFLGAILGGVVGAQGYSFSPRPRRPR
jgi:hypothetical protein